MIVEDASAAEDLAKRESAGEIVMNAVVGTCRCFFEIRQAAGGVVTYWVYGVNVPREVYRDALITAHFDVYDPVADAPEKMKAVMSD